MLIGILFTSASIPAYAEVQSFQTDKTFYAPGDKIVFSGMVEDDDTGLVTIVIRDTNDKFVLLTQAFITSDNSFERSIDTNDKFSISGIYNSTAFLVNMTAGELARFDYSLDGAPISPSVKDLQKTDSSQSTVTSTQTSVTVSPPPEPEEPESKIASFVDPTKDPQHYIDRYNNEIAYKEWFDTNYPGLTIEEAVGLEIEEPEQVVDVSQYIDETVDPQYYIDRYNSEVSYKEWFDTNFPDLTIYEAVGVSPTEPPVQDIDNSTITEPPLPTQEVSQSVVESSTVTPSFADNAEVGQMLLALGGLGILFGAVYGVKRRVDNNTVQIAKNKSSIEKKVNNNSEQISQNRFWLKKKLMQLKPTEEPVSVIKERLAKGEITVDQYYKLLRALKK